jgi:hypothetical protein
MDANTPEPQNTPDPGTEQDTTEIPQPSAPTEALTTNPPAAAGKRSLLSRPWTWVGIAAAALLLGAGIFVTGLVAGKTLGGEHEWHRDHEAANSQSIKTDSSKDDDEDDEADQAPESKNNQTDQSATAAPTPATKAPAPSSTASLVPAPTPAPPGTP